MRGHTWKQAKDVEELCQALEAAGGLIGKGYHYPAAALIPIVRRIDAAEGSVKELPAAQGFAVKVYQLIEHRLVV